MIKDLLPIGSIVLLKDAQKKLMIFGVKQTDPKNPETEFDYVAVLYPEGNLGLEYQFLFNHSDIGAVIFRGYEDSERQDFIRQLEKSYQSAQNGNSKL